LQEEGVSESVYTGGRSVELSQGGGASGVGGESLRLRWPALAATSDIQAVFAVGGRRERREWEVGGMLLRVQI